MRRSLRVLNPGDLSKLRWGDYARPAAAACAAASRTVYGVGVTARLGQVRGWRHRINIVLKTEVAAGFEPEAEQDPDKYGAGSDGILPGPGDDSVREHR